MFVGGCLARDQRRLDPREGQMPFAFELTLDRSLPRRQGALRRHSQELAQKAEVMFARWRCEVVRLQWCGSSPKILSDALGSTAHQGIQGRLDQGCHSGSHEDTKEFGPWHRWKGPERDPKASQLRRQASTPGPQNRQNRWGKCGRGAFVRGAPSHPAKRTGMSAEESAYATLKAG